MIQVDENKKNTFIWLTKADQSCETTAGKIPTLIAEWKAKGFYPVIFRSGKEDLYDLTFSLLKHNRETAARRETRDARR